MSVQVGEVRWSAPYGSDVHPRLALVRHRGRLYAHSELRAFVVTAAGADPDGPELDGDDRTPQDWWDALLARSPGLANRAAAACTPQDFNVLNLYAMEPAGHA